MVPYRPPAFAPAFPRLGQEAEPAPVPARAPGGYTGIPGVVETLAVLGISAAAVYTGVRAGMRERETLPKYAGWVGGIGAGVIGLLYLGTKALGTTGLPEVRIVVPQGRAA